MPTPKQHLRPAALLLIWGLVLLLVASPCSAPGQNSAPEASGSIDEVTGKPFIDRKVGSALERFANWKARMKKEHFISYLIAYTALLGTVAGGAYGFLAFRFGDAMAPYRRIRNKTILLSLAVGLGLGVFVAVTQIPPTTPGKVTMLLLTIGCAILATAISTTTLFVVQRRFMVAAARRSGFPLSGRLRVP